MISDKANYKDRVALYRVSESDSDLANVIKNNIAEMIFAMERMYQLEIIL